MTDGIVDRSSSKQQQYIVDMKEVQEIESRLAGIAVHTCVPDVRPLDERK